MDLGIGLDKLPIGKWQDHFGKTILGWINQKKKKSSSYSRMMEKRIAKRRARNKVARRSRRINRLTAA